MTERVTGLDQQVLGLGVNPESPLEIPRVETFRKWAQTQHYKGQTRHTPPIGQDMSRSAERRWLRRPAHESGLWVLMMTNPKFLSRLTKWKPFSPESVPVRPRTDLAGLVASVAAGTDSPRWASRNQTPLAGGGALLRIERAYTAGPLEARARMAVFPVRI